MKPTVQRVGFIDDRHAQLKGFSMKKTKTVITIEPKDFFNLEKPRYNGWQGGYGLHGKTKYSRKVKHKGKEYYG